MYAGQSVNEYVRHLFNHFCWIVSQSDFEEVDVRVIKTINAKHKTDAIY